MKKGIIMGHMTPPQKNFILGSALVIVGLILLSPIFALLIPIFFICLFPLFVVGLLVCFAVILPLLLVCIPLSVVIAFPLTIFLIFLGFWLAFPFLFAPYWCFIIGTMIIYTGIVILLKKRNQ
jgi:hypothetical protein